MEEALPHEIGGYKIETLLSKGGMSLIYLGIHPTTHEPLTIKVLSSKYISNPVVVERFLKEAEIIQLTNHPNIIKLYGHGKWTGGVYIAMEFVQGISLRQMILQEAMSLKRALEVVLQISHALTHLHAHGIIHRDLKPENILLTAQGGVKVIDFGISQIYTENNTLKWMGTPFYMSPEQRQDPLNVSFQTDIYSLGMITYELVLGRLCHGVVHLSNVPRGLQKVLAKALQPKVTERYEDIVDFTRGIADYLASPELKKDMRGSDYLGELSESLKEAQSLLIPQVPPDWPRLEVGLASNCNSAISSMYFDFYRPSERAYCVVMGESLTTGVEGLLQIAILKGMVLALGHLIDQPTEFVSLLNRRLYEEKQGYPYSFSLLTLFPLQGKFSYISCGYSPLWYLPVGSDMPRRLIADNPLIGSSPTVEVFSVDSKLNIGDRLVLHAFQAGASQHIDEIDNDEKQFVDTLMENLYLPPQQQVESVFRKLSGRSLPSYTEKPLTVISLTRNQ